MKTHIKLTLSGLFLVIFSPSPALSGEGDTPQWQAFMRRVKSGNNVQQVSAIDNNKSESMVLIEKGRFLMGNPTGNLYEKPVHHVVLDSFYIDKYEVTVKEYAVCVAADKCKEPRATHKSDNWKKANRLSHPVNGVDWENARNFCTFVGKRLPTEAEWEKAATWKDNKKYTYATGQSKISCDDAVMDAGGPGCLVGTTWPVGSKIKEINGTFDMAGNVWEWVSNWYGKYKAGTFINPKGPTPGSSKVFRGGSWILYSHLMRSTRRYFAHPLSRSDSIGFRCAANP
ncbi:MAG: formylglycine-generating enzyme family protein [Proteobacteria bacterium]|nr:formylglycine-generating enzyme family protein [Pseudomonadota bacterium]